MVVLAATASGFVAVAFIDHQTASQPAGDLADQLRVLGREAMTTPALVAADLHHQRRGAAQRGQIPHPSPAGLMNLPRASPAAGAALHRLGVGHLHHQLGLVIMG
jgi:hypothetical protein